MSVSNISQVVTKDVESVQFTFYTDNEVRSSSVKRITSPVLFDNMNRPAPEGLYDPALGPLDQYGSCITCGESALHCPGHCGHIELVLPVYNPLLFRIAAKFMNYMCTFCKHFKLEKKRINKYAKKLELIVNGDVIGAKCLDDLMVGDDLDKGLLSENSSKQYAVDEKKTHTSSCQSERRPWTSLQLAEARATLNALMAELKGSKCGNCKAKVPKIKSHSFGSLYQEASKSSSNTANTMNQLKLDLTPSFGKQSKGPDVVGGKDPKEFHTSSGASENQTMSDDIIDPSEAEVSDTTLEKAPRIRGSEKQRKSKKDANSGLKKDKERYLTPLEVKEHLKELWENESHICSLIWDIQQEKRKSWGKSPSYSMFFLHALLVPPSKFRPPNRMNNMLLEHPQNILYGTVLQSNIGLAEAIKAEKDGSRNVVQVTNKWISLQDAVNMLLDSSTANTIRGKETTGVRQLLEKKEGLFRQNLMGKRVNYACRSVISPDPYLKVNEIGIPPYFAVRLTYPEKVTHWNVEKARKFVRNGPHVYPGATHFEDEQGIVHLSSLTAYQRSSIAKKMLSTPGVVSSSGSGHNIDSSKIEGKTVYRHLQDGDVVLVNRQPTLHKPSMMAHIVRVLKGEKTLRMHYANCSTYNADFDGDEMNVHFPQDEISRSEAYNIVNANEQYIVPTSGDPIRGLIQDHIVSATLLTKRDTFLNKEDYQHLVYNACVSNSAPVFQRGKSLPKVGIVEDDSGFVSLAPTIWKPEPLWTGKQVITTVLNHVTKGRPSFTMNKSGKVPGDYWGKSSGELEVVIQNNEHICGIIDKAQFGKYGLVHIVQELYGANVAGHLLSIFSRLFTGYLQMHGFTCGIADLLLKPGAEDQREKTLEKSEDLGEKVHLQFLGGNEDSVHLGEDIEKVLRSKGETASARLDRLMSSALNRITSEVNNSLFPKGLLKPFPSNCLSLMTTTGAKGGLVNFTQISSLLGQQELEGKRVPRMVSGKTLPCFLPWDSRARAGGFISDRFLTGLRPQEYYFHCMAGRDGLVDTAVKTSRSGYLQRCLIKNLECLKVYYDYTVRDSDGSIIQFHYGEDGVDVMKTSCLTQFDVLATNQKLVIQRLGKDQFDELIHQSSNKEKSLVSDSYTNDLPEALKRKVKGFINSLSKEKRQSLNLEDRRNFLNLMKLKYITSLAQPGEPVGVIAGQSIGEPSTQMTLNTFHFAGRGEMNVTLGIPRLREILMTASKEILTPVMTCPLRQGKTREDAERIAAKLRRIRFADLIESLDVSKLPFSVQNGRVFTVYKLKIKLFSPAYYPPYSGLTLKKCENVFHSQFLEIMNKKVKAAEKLARKGGHDAIRIVSDSQIVGSTAGISDDDSLVKSKSGEQAEDEDDQDEEANDEGADAQKRKAQVTDEMDYDDEVDENEISLCNEDNPLEGEDNDDNCSTVQDEEAEDEDIEQENFSEFSKNLNESMLAEKKASNKNKHQPGKNAEGRIFEADFLLPGNTNILLAQIAENVAKQVFVHSVSNIDRCSIIDYNGDPNIPALQTDGINFKALLMLGDELDLARLTTNNINAMLETYGVESARATIVAEVKSVFDSYGIAVNSRHLSLIADFMTFDGGFRPMSRIGIGSNTSPFLKMTFETATKFIVESCLQGETDCLESPSSRIVLGQVAKVGTGCFDILQNLQVS
ncbi:hypothetical protein SUGI_0496070 [Cryptomeria japonica]|uniref:DNA-directed RNA polymerase I subunit 1 isoform X1 n=2 Tax=Cryptomeria japonica TaxID=3369 RepID=UPI002408C8EF|nr:DNA-directed RNA polymerase I subunit 1 isoform X1 [Cryptomeria japonica]GLJ25883.1 hypothetical protein SUGI_0496070 [Cryptomeria japonica]